MALTHDEMERLRRLQRQLDLLRRKATEQGIRRIGHLYDDVLRQVMAGLEQVAAATDETELEAAFRRVMRLGEKGLQNIAGEVQSVIERLIEQAARHGFMAPEVLAVATVLPGAQMEQLVRVVETLERVGQRPGSFIQVSFEGPSNRVADQIKKKVYDDGLDLSQRLHRRNLQQQAEFKQALTEGIQRGRAAAKLAKDLQQIGGIAPELPGYLDKVVQAARSGDQAAFQKALDKARKIADSRKAGPLGVRDFTRQFLSRMRKANAEQIDEFVQDYLRRKARYHATVIARHETNEANRTARKEAAAGKAWVRGMKWNLSGSHPSKDECDDHATQDLYGLGPGVYPVDKYPDTPHPNCVLPGQFVATMRGQLPIEQVAPGDEVLTHTGRWRRVTGTQAHSYSGQVVRITTKSGCQLIVTVDHLIATNQGWVEAGSIRPGDRLLVLR